LQDATVVTAASAAVSQSDNPAQAETSHQSSSSVYARLGIRPLINGMGTYTVLGGSLMPPEVLHAMAEAAQSFVSIPELQVKVGARIAELIGVPAACVTAGAASAITVATAACVARDNRTALHQLPDTTGLKNEVILQESHRSGYEAQIELVGTRLVWVKTRDELDRAINDRTAMLFFLNKADSAGSIRRAEWIHVGRERGVPTFNDAAADVPPASRLASYVREGFDLVAFSGGKGLCGPQATGLLLGRKDLVEAGQKAISPEHGIGRGMKVGKEELIGLLVAVERYLRLDHDAERREWEDRVSEMIAALERVPGLVMKREIPEIANHTPHLLLTWNDGSGKPTAQHVAKLLREGDPPIAVLAEGERTLRIAVWMMRESEHRIVARRLEEIFKPT
jgi:L-seryl-tRNA(Ser) seleniumtransferase